MRDHWNPGHGFEKVLFEIRGGRPPVPSSGNIPSDRAASHRRWPAAAAAVRLVRPCRGWLTRAGPARGRRQVELSRRVRDFFEVTPAWLPFKFPSGRTPRTLFPRASCSGPHGG